MNFLQKAGIGCSLVLILGITCIIFGGMPFAIVQKGNIGVKMRLGRVVDTVYQPGLQWKTPFLEKFDQVDIKQKNAVEHSEAASKDLQKIKTDVKFLYSINPLLVSKAYDRIGNRDIIEETLILPAIKECFKSITARYTAEELITKRNEVSIAIMEN